MNKFKIPFAGYAAFILLVLYFSTGKIIAQDNIVRSNDVHIRYSGRMEAPADSAAVISWTASSIKFNFYGTEVKAVMKDEIGENFYDIIVDDRIVKKLHLTKGKKEYTLCSGLKKGKHSFELFKCTEAAMGRTWIYNFQLDAGARLLHLSPAPKRKIEFYGNSITCGYGIEDTAGKGSNGASQYEDAYLTYASLTARHFNADYRCITKSGIGVLVSWFPLIMPEMYDRIYYDDSTLKWNFSAYTPDVVIVNLFQNDSWLIKMHDHPEFKHRFGTTSPGEGKIIAAYTSLIKNIASRYPSAKIICALGNMDATKKGAPWFGYIQKAVASLNNKNIYTCFFPYKGTTGHPNIKEHQQMADVLIAFIEKNIKW